MINAIEAQSPLGIAGATPPARTPTASGAGFADVLTQTIASAVNTIQTAETASISGIRGAASVASVVDSVMEAQRALQALVAVRDKAVAAYQEISRMAI